ncbi:HSP70 family protein [Lasiodiplodia theobromae]|uniref:HSP70 family protein n=1 Tax=Lasiodiplodia theobromae TaxID=45133 RepID=UPI0015C34B98|nr:HSP70 family protein [Lasiodiplodia theobromae]KAF4544176.1 HSP70 family protein [Lasiodiplodia theobromae]
MYLNGVDRQQMSADRPHMVVAVDFGMTCTGVSYANLSIGSETIRWIQKWPGRGQANENKVPTVLVYPHNSQIPSSWGFNSETISEQTADDREYREWFKTYLDVFRLQRAQAELPNDTPKSIHEVEKLFEDYMRHLYQHIEFVLSYELAGAYWPDAYIEFIFSVPTTWNNHTVERFRTIIHRAGFGQHLRHVVSIGLTEAEAAAVHTSTEASGIFRDRDILLVCDAGGGTTDLSVLKVVTNQSQWMSLQQLDVVFGETIGSAAIDNDFENLALQRLSRIDRSAIGLEPEEAAWQMMKSKEFQNAKCEHGSPSDTPIFSICVPQIDRNYSQVDIGVMHGEMRFRREDLQLLFDKQVQKLFGLIDHQLERLQRRYPGEQVTHVILSGGLGNSAYVQKRLMERYARGRHTFLNAQNIHFRTAPDPQLAVSKGLVTDHLRKLRSGKSVLDWRCCRASYGTLCKVAYEKNNPDHRGKKVHKDPINGKLYISNAIAWFIRKVSMNVLEIGLNTHIYKGEPIRVNDAIMHNFSRKLTPGDPQRAFPTWIIKSDNDVDILPFQMGPGAEILCEIQSDLSNADQREFKQKNRRFWQTSQRHYLVEYQIQVIIGPADLRFELCKDHAPPRPNGSAGWFNGQKLSRDQPIRVEWSPATPPTMMTTAVVAAEMPATPQTRHASEESVYVPRNEEHRRTLGSLANILSGR